MSWTCIVQVPKVAIHWLEGFLSHYIEDIFFYHLFCFKFQGKLYIITTLCGFLLVARQNPNNSTNLVSKIFYLLWFPFTSIIQHHSQFKAIWSYMSKDATMMINKHKFTSVNFFKVGLALSLIRLFDFEGVLIKTSTTRLYLTNIILLDNDKPLGFLSREVV